MVCKYFLPLKNNHHVWLKNSCLWIKKVIQSWFLICRSKVVKVCFKRKRFFVQIRPDWVRILCTKKNCYLNCAIPNRLQKISLIFFILLEAVVLIAFITVIMVTLLLLINTCILIIQVYLVNDYFFRMNGPTMSLVSTCQHTEHAKHFGKHVWSITHFTG